MSSTGSQLVGLLGLQGAFRDHIPHLTRLGAAVEIIRDPLSLERVERMILPGGESTVMAKFLRETSMDLVLRQHIASGLPVWGICAGAILLAERVDGEPGVLGNVPMALQRNAYGRQVASAIHPISIPVLKRVAFPAAFIRAPRVVSHADRVQVHARLKVDPVFIQHDRVMVTTFHPELDGDDAFHRFFLAL